MKDVETLSVVPSERVYALADAAVRGLTLEGLSDAEQAVYDAVAAEVAAHPDWQWDVPDLR